MSAAAVEASAELDLFRLDGKVAVVTGASSGLGRRFAHVLHGAGAHVVAVARRKDRVDSLATELPNCDPVVADLESDDSLVALADHFVRQYGGEVGVLVNNAGLGGVGAAERTPIENFRRVLEINVVGTFRLTQLVAPQMFDTGGSIVNVGSMFGIVGGGDLSLPAYCASKAGVHGLTRDLATQWARRGVRVNSLAPGYFRSEMTAARLDSPDAQSWMDLNSPIGRAGLAHELDGALLFLASAASSYVTGQVLVVDGGWTAR